MVTLDAAHPEPAPVPPADHASPSTAALAAAVLLLRFSTIMAVLLAVAALPTSALLPIRAIDVSGAHQLSTAQIIAASGVRLGNPRFGHSPARIAARIKRLPWIARADVSIAPSGRVLIRVQERRPFAATPYRGQYLVMDGSGVVMEARPDAGTLLVVKADGALPPWMRLGDRLPQRGVQVALEALHDLPAGVLTPGASVRREVSGELIYVTADHIAVRLGPPRGLRERAAALPQLLQAVRSRGLALDYLDLRFAGSVVMKPAAPARAEGERH